MEQRHRDAIQENFSSLVEQTDLDLMVTALYEKGVFSEVMIEPYKDTHRDVRSRKWQLYRDITRRGPDAFRHLLDALQENGYWTLVRILAPEILPPYRGREERPVPSPLKEEMISISDRKRSGKEQDDPNRNRADQKPPQSQTEVERRKPDPEVNGNKVESAQPVAPTAENDNHIPHFKVVKSTKFFEDDGGDIKLYRTRGRFRGVLVLFCYNSFQHDLEEAREGARVDVDNLCYLFKEVGFQVLRYLNLTSKETKDVLEKLKDGFCREGPETVFVVFSSHGYARLGTGDTDIRCYDAQLISYYEIIEYFNNENFPALKGIPKVFIFQTCRGSNKDYGSLASSSVDSRPPRPLLEPRGDARGGAARGGGAHDGRVYGNEDREPRNDDEKRDRMYSDILIAHSTIPGYVSHRDKVAGSWYIQALCEVFAAHAHKNHVEELFTLVDLVLRERFATQTSSVDRWGFNRRLYLHPGLFEQND